VNGYDFIEIDFILAPILAKIAVGYAKIGQKDKATDLLSQSLQMVQSEKSAKENQDPLFLATIALGYAEAGQKDKAADLLSQTLQIVQSTKTAKNKASILAKIAIQYIEAEQNNKATEILSQSPQPPTTEQATLFDLPEIALGYAGVGQKDKAAALLSQSLQMVQSTEIGVQQKSQVLAKIALGYAEVGQKEKATEILFQISSDRAYVEFEKNLAYALDDVKEDMALAYAKAGQRSKALQIAQVIKDPLIKAVTLAKLHYKCVKDEGAKEVLHQIIQETFK